MPYHGQIVWNELNTWNAQQAKEYYSAVLDWTFDEAPTADTKDGHPCYTSRYKS